MGAIVIVIILVFIAIGVNMLSNRNYIDVTDDFSQMIHKYDSIEGCVADNSKILIREGRYSGQENNLVKEQVVEKNGIEYVFGLSEQLETRNGEFIYMVIKNPNIKIGSRNLSVGMSKEDVGKIMNNTKSPKPPRGKYAYYNENKEEIVTEVDEYCDSEYLYSVGFAYDDNNNVEAIFIGKGPNQ